MATFVLVHGAGDTGWSWHLVAAALQEILDDDDGMIVNSLDTDSGSAWAASLSPEIDTWLQQTL